MADAATAATGETARRKLAVQRLAIFAQQVGFVNTAGDDLPREDFIGLPGALTEKFFGYSDISQRAGQRLAGGQRRQTGGKSPVAPGENRLELGRAQ